MQVAISFLAINIIGAVLFLGGEAGLQTIRFRRGGHRFKAHCGQTLLHLRHSENLTYLLIQLVSMTMITSPVSQIMHRTPSCIPHLSCLPCRVRHLR